MIFDFFATLFLLIAGVLPILADIGGFLFLCICLWLCLSRSGRVFVKRVLNSYRYEFRCDDCSAFFFCKAKGCVLFPCKGFQYVEKK